MKFRKHFDYDVEKASNEATLEGNGISSGESLTVQSMSEDADINVMMKRMGVTGKFPENPRVPQYGDFSGVVTDFQTAMNAIIDAEASFMEFPPDIRDRFKNSPQLMMEFCDDKENWEEAKKLGILSESSIAARKAASEAAAAARRSEVLEAARAAGWAPPAKPAAKLQQDAAAPVVP